MQLLSSFARFDTSIHSPGTLRSRVIRFAFGALVLAFTSGSAFAQEGAVGGTVVSGPGGHPVAQAQVRVAGSERGAVTDASGRFRIGGLTGDQVTLEVRRIGFRPMTQAVRVGATDLRLSLTEQTVALDEVVVTGTAGGQARREIGNAVTTINAAEALEKAAIPNVQQLLNGRAPGVFINSATGNVGAGARIRIRGASSLSLLNEPLLYVDGVRVNNAAAAGPANQSFSSASISRINDINPDDIESIEVIRGPAAATLYGTEASNGVIQIFTKKGTTGAPRWSANVRAGRTYIRDPEGRWPVNWQTIPAPSRGPSARDTVSIDIIDLENARGTPVFTTGTIREYDLNASGGSDLFKFFSALGLEDTDGVEPTSWVKRYSGRVNLSIVPNARFNIGLNMGYLNGKTHLPCEAGCGGKTWTTISATPGNYWIVDPRNPTQLIVSPRRGFHSGRPEDYDTHILWWQDLERFTGSLQMSHQPYSWLRHRLSAGTDRTVEGDNYLQPRAVDSLARVLISGPDGGRFINTRRVNYYTLDYSASGVWDPTQALRSTTSIGAQYYRNSTAFQSSSGDVFPTAGLTALSATTINKSTFGDIEEDATLGFFLQEQLGLNDRLFVTAAVRADDNSAFGQNFDRVYYPKYSLSWVASEEPFWRFPVINALKFRAAYGEAGKQPLTYSALQTYTAVTGPSDVATVTPQFIGNPDLGPERSKEIEMGFDLGALADRLGVEFTWYRKTTTDAILDRQIAPSIGVSPSTGSTAPANTQPFNAGRIRNWGTEFLIRARPLVRENFEWDAVFSWATNDSEIEDLGTPFSILEARRQTACPGYVPGTSDPASCPVDDFVGAGSFLRHQVGYPIGSYFERRVVSAQLDATGQRIASTVMCDDGKGGSVLCSTAPLVFIGRSLPSAEGAFSSTLTFWKNFRLYGLVDFKRDYIKVDGNTRVRCQIFIRCRENFYPLEFEPKRIAAIQSGGTLIDYYLNDAGYAKLREISVSYTLPPIATRFATFNRAVLTLAGRNLHTWTDYPGLEPEAFFLGGSRGGNFGQFEQTTNPQLTSWVLGLNLDW